MTIDHRLSTPDSRLSTIDYRLSTIDPPITHLASRKVVPTADYRLSTRWVAWEGLSRCAA